MEKKEIIQKLKDSLEVSNHWQWIITEPVIILIAGFIYFLTNWSANSGEDLWILFVVPVALIMIPLYTMHAWELWKIFRKAESYVFYQVKLSQPHASRWFRSMYFTVLLQDEEGTIVANTHSIFGTHRHQIGPIIEDYVNQTVTVAYNEETGEVVVIG